jgi:zinc transport system ATP-binding protein
LYQRLVIRGKVERLGKMTIELERRKGAVAVLAADSVSFAYGPDLAVDHVSFELGPGEFVALVGPNGAGKSTLLRLLLGLLRPDSGTVRCLGEEPRRLSDRGRLGYVPQRGVFPPDLPATVAEVVASGRLSRRGWWQRARRTDRDAVDHALASVALAHLRERRVTTLSGGQQQRVLIAKALVSEPEVLVLDEPVAGVDAESQRLFRDSLTHMITEHGATVLLASHELAAVADDLDRIIVLKRKVVFDGPPADLVATGVSLGIHRDDLPLWLEELG